ncbi:hypothetical protein, partial [Nocardia sp. NPDC059239]|uniref:hypothetical protein n=1 Tax=Nocardia sp. NPDC059239 TaxID=3346785 RepID=UPI0036B84EBE
PRKHSGSNGHRPSSSNGYNSHSRWTRHRGPVKTSVCALVALSCTPPTLALVWVVGLPAAAEADVGGVGTDFVHRVDAVLVAEAVVAQGVEVLVEVVGEDGFAPGGGVFDGVVNDQRVIFDQRS